MKLHFDTLILVGCWTFLELLLSSKLPLLFCLAKQFFFPVLLYKIGFSYYLSFFINLEFFWQVRTNQWSCGVFKTIYLHWPTQQLVDQSSSRTLVAVMKNPLTALLLDREVFTRGMRIQSKTCSSVRQGNLHDLWFLKQQILYLFMHIIRIPMETFIAHELASKFYYMDFCF